MTYIDPLRSTFAVWTAQTTAAANGGQWPVLQGRSRGLPNYVLVMLRTVASRSVAARCLTVTSSSFKHDVISTRRSVSRLFQQRPLVEHRLTTSSATLFAERRYSSFAQSTSADHPAAAAATTTTTTGQSSFVTLKRCGRPVLVERIEVHHHHGRPESAEEQTSASATDHDAAASAAAAIKDLETLIEDAVNRRDNVAVDEFVDIQRSLNCFMTSFLVRDPATRRPLAAVLLEPFRAARTLRPRLALLHIITASHFTDVDQLGDLASLGCQLAVDLNRGFTACVSSVFYESPQRVATLRREGFLVVACLPQTGKLKTVDDAQAAAAAGEGGCRGDGIGGVTVAGKAVCGNKTGYSNSYLMYRRLDVEQNVQPLSDAELERYADVLTSTSTSGRFDESALWSTAPAAPGFPLTVHTTDGLRVRVRQIGVEDVGRYYDSFLAAADIDQGFRRDEIPTRRVFSCLYSGCWNMVAEDADTGRWIAVFSMSPSPFTRSRKSVISDGSLILMPEYRNRRRGLAAELMCVFFRVMVDLGFVAVLSDTAIDNLQAVFSSTGNGMLAVGTLPDAMYARHSADRSTDVVIVYMSLEGTQGLLDWAETQRKLGAARTVMLERFRVPVKPLGSK